MARKFTDIDKALFKTVFLQFPWIPPSHLAQMMQALAAGWGVPEKWADFNQATAFRWIKDGNWKDQVESVARFVDDGEPLPNDDEIDDMVMRRNLQLLDRLAAKIAAGIDEERSASQYTRLQREIRNHVQTRRMLPLTPTQLIALFIKAGLYAAGGHFDADKARDFLLQSFSEARQLAPIGEAARG